MKKGEASHSIEWDNDADEFENVCCFAEVSGCYQRLKYSPWDVSFNVLYATSFDNSSAKMVSIGKVVVNVAELAARMVFAVEEKLPITLNIDRTSLSAKLHVKVTFGEIRDYKDRGFARDSNESRQLQCLSKSNSILCDRKGHKLSQEEETWTRRNQRRLSGSSSPPSLETQADSVKKAGWFSWKRRRLSLDPPGRSPEPSTEPRDQNEGSRKKPAWEVKEIQSRDGQTRLKTDVFFASFDQCSDKAAGESACTALVVVISHWLQSNRDAMPTRSEFDDLILQGSTEWRKLCQNETYINDFPNKHFDLETVEGNSYYIIDTLGERLFEGCSKAYILRFDNDTMMYENADEKMILKSKEEIICKGKECCREFIKRFLVANPLKELEEQEKKETVMSRFII
ncbi:hypothetical protein HAX54_049565 [Datura stramonium]|uniref:C2 NT-type domain-containing protein n=1 Tax=Datura stramonium TaxID=4076 RepID=A0ABS8WKJ7_DATST|nr:hypothetical protein [Datura stramonium]